MRALALVVLLALPLAARADAPPLPAKFRMGYLSDRVEYSVQYMAPALEWFRQKLAPLGVREVSLEVAPSLEEMGDWVRSGKVDVFVSTPYPVLKTARIAGVRPVLQGIPLKVKHSAIYVRADSAIKTLADLDGKRLAFTFTYSSPGYFVPILHLMSHGFVIDHAVPGRKVVYTSLTGHYTNSLYWLYFGRCDAAAVGDDDWVKLAPRLQQSIRLLDTSDAYPGFFVLISPTWTPAQQQAITHFLSEMHTDPAGRALLHNAYSCDRMAPLDPPVLKWIQDADAAITALGAGRN